MWTENVRDTFLSKYIKCQTVSEPKNGKNGPFMSMCDRNYNRQYFAKPVAWTKQHVV